MKISPSKAKMYIRVPYQPLITKIEGLYGRALKENDSKVVRELGILGKLIMLKAATESFFIKDRAGNDIKMIKLPARWFEYIKELYENPL